MKLTKREIVLLVFLIVIALVFVEFRFVISPGLEKYYDYVDQNNALEAQVAEININLAAAKTNQSTIEENLTKIDDMVKNFLPSLKSDQLLVMTHEMMQRNGFLPTSYTISPVQLTTVTPTTVNLVDLVYQIKTLSQQFAAFNAEISNTGTNSNVSDEAVPTGEPLAQDDQVEHFSISITATATYDQILQLLNDLHGYQKTILISTFSLSPASESTLGIDMTLNFYGLNKLDQIASLDDSNFVTWSRTPYTGHNSDPFYYPVPTDVTGETIIETTETTAETTVP